MPIRRLTLLQRWEVFSPAHTGSVKTTSGLSDIDLDKMKIAMKGQGGNIMFSSEQKTGWEGFNSAIRDNPEDIALQALGTI